MKLERFSSIFLVAGFICFIFAFLFLGVWPSMMTDNMPEDGGMPKTVPAEFKKYYGSLDEYHAALKLGRDIYIKEACWHCHSQYIRPVSNESAYYGLVSIPAEYENELNLPQLFGTRRVGPDLVREAGKRSNDWHIAHLYDPKSTVPQSIMPGFTWYFDESTNPPTPKKGAIALVAYLQNLGKWTENLNRTQHDYDEVTMPPMPE